LLQETATFQMTKLMTTLMAMMDDDDNDFEYQNNQKNDWQPYIHCLHPPCTTTTDALYCQ